MVGLHAIQTENTDLQVHCHVIFSNTLKIQRKPFRSNRNNDEAYSFEWLFLCTDDLYLFSETVGQQRVVCKLENVQQMFSSLANRFVLVQPKIVKKLCRPICIPPRTRLGT